MLNIDPNPVSYCKDVKVFELLDLLKPAKTATANATMSELC